MSDQRIMIKPLRLSSKQHMDEGETESTECHVLGVGGNDDIYAESIQYVCILSVPYNSGSDMVTFTYFTLVKFVTEKYGELHMPTTGFNDNGRRKRWVSELPVSEQIRDETYFKCPYCDNRSFFDEPCHEHLDKLKSLDYMRVESIHDQYKRYILYLIDAGLPLRSEGVLEAYIVPAVWYIDDEAEIIEVEGSDELRRCVNGVWQHKHEGYDYWHPTARVHKH